MAILSEQKAEVTVSHSQEILCIFKEHNHHQFPMKGHQWQIIFKRPIIHQLGRCWLDGILQISS